MYLGVDIGGTAVKIGIVSKIGEILKSLEYDVSFDNYETPIFETVKKSIDKFLKDSNVEKKQIKGIGVSATGQVDMNTGTIIGVGGNIKNWLGTEIKKELENIYNIKTTVVNDANCMILGETFAGRAKGYKNIIGITIGTGVGGGIIVDSNILLGATGIAGEIGHFSINSSGIKCSCGNIGCYEKYASTTALVKNVKEKYKNKSSDNFQIENVDGKIIFEQVKKGNKEIEEIVDKWIAQIGHGLVSLVHIFNPEIIIIGGGVSSQKELFIDKVKIYVEKNSMTKFSKNIKIKGAKLGNNAGIVGAVYYNINNY